MIPKGIGGGVLSRKPTYNNVPGDRGHIVILNVSLIQCLVYKNKTTHQFECFISLLI